VTADKSKRTSAGIVLRRRSRSPPILVVFTDRHPTDALRPPAPILGALILRPRRAAVSLPLPRWRADLVRSGVPPDSANRAVAVMSAFLGTLVAEGKLERNPCTGLKKLPIVGRRPRAISPLEVERIRLELPTLRDVVLVGAMAYAGLRPGEALALSVDSITDNVIVVDRNWTYGELKLTKTERRRTVEIVPPLRDDLRRFLPRRPPP
jgi:integrase